MTTEPNTVWSVWEYRSTGWYEMSQWPTKVDAEKEAADLCRIGGLNKAIALPSDEQPTSDTPAPSRRTVPNAPTVSHAEAVAAARLKVDLCKRLGTSVEPWILDLAEGRG